MKPQEELQVLKSHIQLTENGATKRDGLERFVSGLGKYLLLDADSLLYNVAHFHLDKESDFDIMYEDFLAQVRAISNRIEDDGFIIEDVVYFFTTCSKSFRKELLPSYKENRPKNDTTSLVYEIKKYIIKELINENAPVSLDSELEADDLIPIWINNTDRDNCIICSIDKDLRQIEGAHFDYYKVKTGDVDEFGYDVKDYRGWSYTTKQEGYDLFLKQMLIGDNSDNIKGVEGIGKVGANKIVKGSNFEKLLKVARAYKDMDRMRLNVKLMRL